MLLFKQLGMYYGKSDFYKIKHDFSETSVFFQRYANIWGLDLYWVRIFINEEHWTKFPLKDKNVRQNQGLNSELSQTMFLLETNYEQ